MSEILRKAIADAARVVEERASNVKKIESQIADANSRLKKSEAYRDRFALDAQLGKAQAISEIVKAHAEATAALGDLSGLGRALGEAKLGLAAAEQAAENARRNLRQFEVKILQRERVDIAAEIDEARRNRERLDKIYDELGVRIIGMCDAMHGMSDYEAAMGTKRRMSANLAASEARQWNLPEQPEKSKAA